MSNESRTLNIPSDATAEQMREVYDKYKSVLDEDFRSRESNWNEEAMGKDWPKNGLFDGNFWYSGSNKPPEEWQSGAASQWAEDLAALEEWNEKYDELEAQGDSASTQAWDALMGEPVVARFRGQDLYEMSDTSLTAWFGKIPLDSDAAPADVDPSSIDPELITDPASGDVKDEDWWQDELESATAECGDDLPTSGTEPAACKAKRRAQDALDAFAAARSDRAVAAMSMRFNIDFKEQCFLLAEVFNLVDYKLLLDEAAQGDQPRYGEGDSRHFKRLPYEDEKTNSCIQMEGNPFAYINKMTQNIEKKSAFHNLTTAEISALQPMIRLFKVDLNTDTGKETEKEIKFDTHFTQGDLDIFKEKEARGAGVGIKDFTIVYEADNPFAIKKSIRAQLTLHAASFDELLRDRGGYAYIDLALKTGGGANKIREIEKERLSGASSPQEADLKIQNLSKLLFRLKAIVGWAVPKNEDVQFGVSPDLRDALYDSSITISLTPTIHQFDIDELGRVNFTIEYLAYVEDFFDQPTFNIFSDPDHSSKLLERQLRFAAWAESCNSEEISNIKTNEKEDMDREKQAQFQALVKSLMGSGKVRYLQIPLDVITAYYDTGPSDESTSLDQYFDQILYGPGHTAVEVAVQPDQAAAIKAEAESKYNVIEAPDGEGPSEEVPVSDWQTFSFFYLADLLDIILENIGNTLEAMPDAIDKMGTSRDPISDEDKAEAKRNYKRYLDNFKKYRLVLGPIEVTNSPQGNGEIKSRMCSIGDLPVSTRYFLEWLTKKVLQKDKAVYNLPNFVNDLVNELMRNFLNSDQCFGNIAKQKTRLAQTALTAYTPDKDHTPKLDELTLKILAENEPSIFGRKIRRLNINTIPAASTPVLSVNGGAGPISNPGLEQEMHYMIYYASRVQPAELMQGVRADDHARGLWHYQIGRDKGIVKTIDLKKTNSTGLREVRFEQEGYDGLQQLREVYDATINTYADVGAFPGNYIYISPGGFSPLAAAGEAWDLTQFGIGGYHMIIRSEHSFGPGKADTTITAKWVAEIESAAAAAVKSASTGPTSSTDPAAQTSDKPSKCMGPYNRRSPSRGAAANERPQFEGDY